MTSPSASFSALIKTFRYNHTLILQMTKRDVIGRYRGSFMGLAWSLLNPLIMLTIYTVVFSEIFKARWGAGNQDESKTQFAMILFTGMIFLNFFNETLNRAPILITGNVNYVKKVVFPLEILPITAIGAAIFHSFVSFCILAAALLALSDHLYWTGIFIPLIFLPLIVLSLGLAWILASLGTFLRDIGQTITLATTMLMFVTPVFYPITAIPEKFRPIVMANPLTFIIEQARAVLIWGQLPDFEGLALYMAVAVAVAWAGFAWFQKTRRGFADVL